VLIRALRYEITGVGGYEIPVYLLDLDLAGNYCQEVILGIGGVRILRAIGYNDIKN